VAAPSDQRRARWRAECGLIGTAEHGVLGRRWIYDGTRDPVLVTQLVALTQGQAEPQTQGASNTPDRDQPPGREQLPASDWIPGLCQRTDRHRSAGPDRRRRRHATRPAPRADPAGSWARREHPGRRRRRAAMPVRSLEARRRHPGPRHPRHSEIHPGTRLTVIAQGPSHSITCGMFLAHTEPPICADAANC